MSKTSIKERNKAIRLAWEREQALVAEGKGTRDWTKEQQQDILDPYKGKAYDDNGRAFEGQHMKSAAEYPEYQGNPDNIQFLTREEHLEAHKGSWQNPTNWYYNPETKEFVDFGDSKPIPCEVLTLSESLQSPAIESPENSTNKGNSDQSESKKPVEQSDLPTQQEITARLSERTSPKTSAVTPPEVHESLGEKVLHVVDAVKGFAERHPILTGVAKAVGAVTVAVWTEAIANSGKGLGGGSRSSSSSSNDYFSNPSSNDDYYDSFRTDDYDNSLSGRDYPDERSSPREHDVSGYYRQQNGKIVRVNPYKRGGKHEDD